MQQVLKFIVPVCEVDISLVYRVTTVINTDKEYKRYNN